MGPFRNRENVKRFIEMMALCGENWAGSRIVEGGGDDAPWPVPHQVDSGANRLRAAGRLQLAGTGRRP